MKAVVPTTVANTKAVMSIFMTHPSICTSAVADTGAVSLALFEKVDRAKRALFPD
jgi:hypothetical protein